MLISPLVPKIEDTINTIIKANINDQISEIIYFIVITPYFLLTVPIIQLLAKTSKIFIIIFNYCKILLKQGKKV